LIVFCISRVKRRQSNSDDSDNFNQYETNKRFRGNRYHDEQVRKSVKERLGSRSDDSNSNESQPRHILDLDIGTNSGDDQIAREIAEKLYEKKDDLLR
jgi:phosphorylated adapter RNA export protein